MFSKLFQWLFKKDINKIESNLKKYETNRKIYSN